MRKASDEAVSVESDRARQMVDCQLIRINVNGSSISDKIQISWNADKLIQLLASSHLATLLDQVVQNQSSNRTSICLAGFLPP